MATIFDRAMQNRLQQAETSNPQQLGVPQGPNQMPMRPQSPGIQPQTPNISFTNTGAIADQSKRNMELAKMLQMRKMQEQAAMQAAQPMPAASAPY